MEVSRKKRWEDFTLADDETDDEEMCFGKSLPSNGCGYTSLLDNHIFTRSLIFVIFARFTSTPGPCLVQFWFPTTFLHPALPVQPWAPANFRSRASFGRFQQLNQVRCFMSDPEAAAEMVLITISFKKSFMC